MIWKRESQSELLFMRHSFLYEIKYILIISTMKKRIISILRQHLLIIKKDELLLISKGLDYSYFGESRIKVKVNWCQLCLFCISLLSIKKSENHSLLKQLLTYIVFYTQYVIYELILTLIMEIVNNISKKYFLNLYN